MQVQEIHVGIGIAVHPVDSDISWAGRGQVKGLAGYHRLGPAQMHRNYRGTRDCGSTGSASRANTTR